VIRAETHNSLPQRLMYLYIAVATVTVSMKWDVNLFRWWLMTGDRHEFWRQRAVCCCKTTAIAQAIDTPAAA